MRKAGVRGDQVVVAVVAGREPVEVGVRLRDGGARVADALVGAPGDPAVDRVRGEPIEQKVVRRIEPAVVPAGEEDAPLVDGDRGDELVGRRRVVVDFGFGGPRLAAVERAPVEHIRVIGPAAVGIVGINGVEDVARGSGRARRYGDLRRR